MMPPMIPAAIPAASPKPPACADMGAVDKAATATPTVSSFFIREVIVFLLLCASTKSSIKSRRLDAKCIEVLGLEPVHIFRAGRDEQVDRLRRHSELIQIRAEDCI